MGELQRRRKRFAGKRPVGAGLCLLVLGLAMLGAGGAGAQDPGAVITSESCTANTLAANDDQSSSQVALPFSINFFGTTYSSLYVNNNGNVTFARALGTFTPSPFVSAETPLIAPFWADVDTRGAGSGLVQYGAISTGTTAVNGHAAFCVNWVNVGYYGSHTDKLNSFQLVLIDRSDTGTPGNFDIEMNYDKVQWETGDASEGTNGLGGSPARIGYSSGSTSFELPGSGSAGAFLDSNTATGLIHNSNNSQVLGRYVFPVRNGAALGHSISGHVWQIENGSPAAGAIVQACPTVADPNAPCRNATANSDGLYAFNNLPDLSSGGNNVDHDWNLVANPPGDSSLGSGTRGPITVAGEGQVNQDIVLHAPRPLPEGASLSTPRGTVSQGVPTVYGDDQLTVAFAGCAGGGTATLTVSDGYTKSVDLHEGTAVFGAVSPHYGMASITLSLCDASHTFDLYIDPRGVVLTTQGNPIAGATVTLLRADDPAGPFTAVPDDSAIMSPGNRRNPDSTDAEGQFGWDVLSGYYKVRAAKSGCTAPNDAAYAESDVLTIPPAATQLVLRLDCAPATTTTTTTTTTTETTATSTTTTTTEATTTEATTTAAPPPPPPPPPRADVQVSVAAPASARVHVAATFTATVRNAGPNTSTGVALHATVPAGATLRSASSTAPLGCTGGPNLTCLIGTLGAGGSATVTLVLVTDQPGALTASASVEGDYDQNAGNNSSSATVTVLSADAPAPPPPPPAQPGTFNAASVGTVKVNGVDQPADQIVQLSSGDAVDVTGGSITFTASDGSFGVFSGAPLTAARRVAGLTRATAAGDVPAAFKVTEAAVPGAITELALTGGDFSACASPRSLAAPTKPIQRLWGSAKGNFKTKGRFSAATIRGTVWSVEDRCDGTLTTDIEDPVEVFDFSLNKTITLSPGQTYLAKPPAKTSPYKPPATKPTTPGTGKGPGAAGSSTRTQTPADITRQGLRWSQRTFTTRTDFEAWLLERGHSWQEFAQVHPRQAAALARRG